MRENSDLDVLVIVPDDANPKKTTHDIYINLIGFGIGVDVIVATRSQIEQFRNNASLVYSPALNEGRVIYAA